MTANIAEQLYARKVQALIKLITDLRALGAQTDIDLPRIAVIGNQSAGKSSLVEAITKITLPRASGTCTRCPMECRLANTKEAFKCQVLLRIEKDEYGNSVSEVKETKFGPPLHDKDVLEDMLRRAQLAILNPSVEAHRFVDFDLENLDPGELPLGSKRQLQFSSNVVCLDITSPDVTNLSFIDLPGIISNVADDEDPANIDLIKNLVRENIKGNALILLTITMRDDIQNQSAALLAKEADPKGERTIGVLTKPDTLQEGEHADWIDVLSGHKHPLTHGYYVTKQAGPAELKSKLSYEEGRERELSFFSSVSPWASQEARVRQRMGVPNLTKQLSTLLSRLIEKTLPKLKADSRDSLKKTLQDLHELPPPPPENPTAELLKLITKFTTQLDGLVRGSARHEKLIQDSLPAYEEFKTDILTTRPMFVPFLRSENKDDYSKSKFTFEITKIRGPEPESSRVVEENIEREFPSEQKPMYLDEVRDLIRCKTTRELPFNIPYQAKVHFIEMCFDDWTIYAHACFDKVWNAYRNALDDIIKMNFEKFTNGGLCDHVRNIVEYELELVKDTTLERIKWLLELEKDPFTLNHHYLSSYRERYLTSFREQRQKKSGKFETDPGLIQDALASLAAIGKNHTEEDLSRLDGPDPYESELTLMAEVSAYFRVAYKRIIDNIPRVIDLDFLKGLNESMQSALINGLHISDLDGKAKAEVFLSEDPSITERRAALDQIKERLVGITTKLNNFSSL